MKPIQKIGRVLHTLAAVVFLLSAVRSQGQSFKPAKTGYAPVNGLKMYYEVYGEGKPVVLIHGAFNTISLSFGPLIPGLSKTRKVIAIELQGHGRTADTDRPFSAEAFADDVAGLLGYLKLDSSDILGYSLGGEVALQMAIRHPRQVRKLVIISAPYKMEGWSPETRAIFPLLAPEWFEGTPVKTEYDSLAPNPKNWTSLVTKIKALVNKDFDLGKENIKAINKPALIISADGDGLLPEHAVELYRLFGGGYLADFGPAPRAQLAIYPGSSHISVMFHTDWLLGMVQPFLDIP